MIHKFSEEYSFLSNFWYVRVNYQRVDYPSVEHAYQAAKTHSIIDREIIKGLTVGKAKRYGKVVELRDDWQQIKDSVMLQLLRQKFKLNKALQSKLLETGEQPIIEGNSWHDNYFGVCDCISCSLTPGLNMLGILLMQVRSEIRQELLEKAIDKTV